METTLLATASPLYRRLRDLTVDVLELHAEQITPEASFSDDLGADSLDLVELVEAIEAEFAIQIDDEELADIRTVGEAYDIVAGNWTAIMGPKGLAPAQIAYWEDLLERTFKHPAWQGMLEADALEADFRKSQPMRELLARDEELERRMLAELGMVKPEISSK